MVVTDGFTGNVALKLMEGTTRTVVGAIRDADPLRHDLEGGRAADPLARSASCASGSTRRRVGGAYLLGLRGLVVVCHGASTAARSRTRSRSPSAAVASRTSTGRTGAALEADAGGDAEPASVPADSFRRASNDAAPSTREEVLELIRAHLSEELGIDASMIEEGSRFKEDLEADSLDLVELVVELEDRYGIRIGEDQAERIKTVGQAVDFVLAHAPVNPTP